MSHFPIGDYSSVRPTRCCSTTSAIWTPPARLHDAIDAALAPFAEAVILLQPLPGVCAVAAATIVAEIGVNMARFPDPAHLASRADVCWGTKQRGSKCLRGKTTKGSSWLRAVLTEVA